jgi:hypothetical protein
VSRTSVARGTAYGLLIELVVLAIVLLLVGCEAVIP